MDISYLPVVQFDDHTAEKVSGGAILVFAAPGIEPDGNPSTPPGNSGVMVPATIGVFNPQGKFKGFAQNPAPLGIQKNGNAFLFDPVTGVFTPV